MTNDIKPGDMVTLSTGLPKSSARRGIGLVVSLVERVGDPICVAVMWSGATAQHRIEELSTRVLRRVDE